MFKISSIMASSRRMIVVTLLLGPSIGYPQSGKKPDTPPVLLVALQPYGFEPSVVSTSVRRFLLIVQNRSGIRELTFHLDVVKGNRIKDVNLHATNPRHAELLDLNPGTYTLSEANHPQWKCQITIQ